MLHGRSRSNFTPVSLSFMSETIPWMTGVALLACNIIRGNINKVNIKRKTVFNSLRPSDAYMRP